MSVQPAAAGSAAAGAVDKATPAQRVLTAVAAIATLTFQVLLTPLPTHLLADRFVRDDLSPASHAELVEVAEKTLAYCARYPGAELDSLKGYDSSTSFTSDVIGHLDDVEVFFSGMKLAALVAAACVAASLVALRRVAGRARFRRQAGRAMVASVCVVGAVVAVMVIVALVDFNALHSLFFSSGSWLFPYDSLLICALPEEFWMSMGVLWAVLVVIACAALLIAGRRLSR